MRLIEGQVGVCIEPIAPLIEGRAYIIVRVRRFELFNLIDMVEVKDTETFGKASVPGSFFPWRFRF